MKLGNVNLSHELAETATVSDPWGFGWSFEIARAGSRFGRSQQELLLKDPLAKKIARAAIGAQVGRAKEVEFSDQDLEAMVDPAKLAKSERSYAELVAKHLVRGWSGVKLEDGSEVEFRLETAVELLLDREHWLPPDEDGEPIAHVTQPLRDKDSGALIYPGGCYLGEAVRTWVMAEANKAQSFYREHQEDLRKN